MQRIKATVALILALVWLPAISCCLLDAASLLGKQDCCSKDHSHSPISGTCQKPCGELASASYLTQENSALVFAPVGLQWIYSDAFVAEIKAPLEVHWGLPATAPPVQAGHWQFNFRTASSPRAPSMVS